MVANGNVGIGTTTPACALDVTGTMRTTSWIQCGGTLLPAVTNSITLGQSANVWSVVYAANGIIQTSDENEKDSVPLSYGMSNLMNVSTIKFKWHSQSNLPDNDPAKNYEYYGFCARELDTIFPELVYNENAPYQLNYCELLPIVVNAVKELNLTIQSMRTEIDMLKSLK